MKMQLKYKQIEKLISFVFIFFVNIITRLKIFFSSL